MAVTDAERFADDGFLVVRGVLDSERCVQLLGEVVAAFSSVERSYLHESEFRTHCPLRLTPPVESAIRGCVRRSHAMLDGFLRRGKRLVELSSITVYPNARAQPIHFDEDEPGKHIVTVFINLVPTERDVGALRVVPGSHRGGQGEYCAPRVLELPAGAAVFMNGKLRHGGTRNGSIDRIRPVLYFSFGDDDMRGPSYSLRPEYRGKFDLAHFHVAAPDRECRPRLVKEHWVAFKLARSTEPRELILMNGSRAEQRVVLGPEDEWLAPFFQKVADGADPLSAGELAEQLGLEIDALLATLTELGDMGVLTW